jgi:hypothetical protein
VSNIAAGSIRCFQPASRAESSSFVVIA